MDEQIPHPRASIPRLSKLPMPRASHDNLRSIRPTASHGDLRQRGPLSASGGQRLAATATLLKESSPLGESINRSIRSRFGFGWGVQNDSPVTSPVGRTDDVPEAASTLHTTPPASTASVAVDDDLNVNTVSLVVDENAATVKQRARPRPSLSERTAETLSSLSPSPSPARRRSSVVSNGCHMGPPSRPASAMNRSRPSTSHSVRSMSPTKRPSRPRGSISPTKEVPPLPPLPSPSSIYTPPKALISASRIARPPRRSVSAMVVESAHSASHANLAYRTESKTYSMKHNMANSSKTVISRAKTAAPEVSNIFKDPPRLRTPNSKLDLSNLDKNIGLLKPRSPGENTLAPSGSSSTLSTDSKSPMQSSRSSTVEGEARLSPINPSKTSATLRGTMAQAKAAAAKKAAMSNSEKSAAAGLSAMLEDSFSDPAEFSGDHRLVLKNRVQAAAVNGNLNIAAMKLKELPDEVMMMYEPDDSTPINWAETVDLVKLLAGDNELESLREDAFPDWTAEELAADESKSNQFGGLEVLDLHNNILREIPMGIRRLGRLQKLNLSKNKLSFRSLEFICQIPSLRDLHLAENDLSGTLTEAIGGLINLQVLDVRCNNIEALPASIADLSCLKNLNLSENKLRYLPGEALQCLGLVEINASKNKLDGTLFPMDLALNSLRHLDVSYNQLEAVSRGGLKMPQITTLAVENNKLPTLNVSTYRSLATLTASSNVLEELPFGFTNLPGLKNADLSNNNIKVLDPALAKMENLSLLNIVGNALRERKYLSMVAEDIKLDLAKKLGREDGLEDCLSEGDSIPTGIALTDDLITSTPDALMAPKNGTLDLSSRSFTNELLSSLPLHLSQPIHTLLLQCNSLTNIPHDLLSHPSLKSTLHTLDISHNPLHNTAYLTVPLTLPTLQTLNIISTGLTSLDALTTHLSAPVLTTLNISCHRLAGALPRLRTVYPSLTTLLATDNWFSSLDVEAVRGLEVLDVANNQLENLPPKLGLLGPLRYGGDQTGRLRSFYVLGNRFRVPRQAVLERGTEAVLADLRRMVPVGELGGEWEGE